MTNFIWVKTQFEGFHKYEHAPQEVSYLRNTHRHMFELKVFIEIFEDDRDIEFHMFKKFVIHCIETKNFHNKSCEMISNDLNLLISNKYPKRNIKIEISEDGECGCEMQYNKHQNNINKGTWSWSGLGPK